MNKHIKYLVESFLDNEEEINDIDLPEHKSVYTAKVGELITQDNTGMYYICAPDDNAIAICVASWYETPDKKPLFMKINNPIRKGYKLVITNGEKNPFPEIKNFTYDTGFSIGDQSEYDTEDMVFTDYDGYKNTEIMYNSKKNTPAANYVKELGPDWYIPAAGEFQFYYKNLDKIPQEYRLRTSGANSLYLTSTIHKEGKKSRPQYQAYCIYPNSGELRSSWFIYTYLVAPFLHID